MSRRILNVALTLLVGLVAYYLIRYSDTLFVGDGTVLTQEVVDSLLRSDKGYLQYREMGASNGSISGKVSDGYSRKTVGNRWNVSEALDAGIEERTPETFPFDPNTADTTALLRLGFPRWMIRSMLKYRAKGGRYRDKMDVKGIYGMTPELYERIENCITIDDRFREYDRGKLAAERIAMRQAANGNPLVNDSVAATTQNAATPIISITNKLPSGVRLDLNQADSATLCNVPGISSGRARQIIAHRQALGGYVSVEQLRELNDFPDSCIAWFIISDINTTKINLNKASLTTLKRHPYINGYQAIAIERYRRTYGRLTSLDQLRLHPDFTPEHIERLRPYVDF